MSMINRYKFTKGVYSDYIILILKDGKYYSIKIAYSSDGLDTRTIVELDRKPELFK